MVDNGSGVRGSFRDFWVCTASEGDVLDLAPSSSTGLPGPSGDVPAAAARDPVLTVDPDTTEVIDLTNTDGEGGTSTVPCPAPSAVPVAEQCPDRPSLPHDP